MTKNVRKAAKVLRMTSSAKGCDFDVVNGARSSVRNYAKKQTRRAAPLVASTRPSPRTWRSDTVTMYHGDDLK